MSSPPSDHALIARFLVLVDGDTHAVAARYLGVDPTTVLLWRKGELPKKGVSRENRAALERFIVGREGPRGVAGALHALDEAQAAVERARDALRESYITPVVALEREGRASVAAAAKAGARQSRRRG
jgi:predicted alternative tryptophan synthase beta-subunit